MRILRFLIQKEFIQIFRNKALLPMMTIVPIFELLVLASAASNEVKDVRVIIVDKDQSTISRSISSKVIANDRFTLVETSFNNENALTQMQYDKTDIILEIPQDFEKKFYRSEAPKMQMLVNAINGQQALIGSSYLGRIIGSVNRDILINEPLLIPKKVKTPTISVSTHNWYNPEIKYPYFMAPGILTELAVMLTIILSAMNVVREREIGTIEQINVTPIKKWQFIVGKLIPFLFIGIMLIIVGLLVSKLIYDIPMRGDLGLFFLYAFVNLSAVLGFGLLISNYADTQQQAIFVAFFFVLVFILMSGLFTPVESMPKVAQYFTIPNPLVHFISVSRKILLKGSGLMDIKWEFIYTIGLALIFNTLSIWSYKKQS